MNHRASHLVIALSISLASPALAISRPLQLEPLLRANEGVVPIHGIMNGLNFHYHIDNVGGANTSGVKVEGGAAYIDNVLVQLSSGGDRHEALNHLAPVPFDQQAPATVWAQNTAYYCYVTLGPDLGGLNNYSPTTYQLVCSSNTGPTADGHPSALIKAPGVGAVANGDYPFHGRDAIDGKVDGAGRVIERNRPSGKWAA